jgi:nucleotide-binding universal stress UspA family protein
MKKILMATDLSARSDRALQRAMRLAVEQKAALEIVHVVDDTLPQRIIERHEEGAYEALGAQILALPGAGSIAVTPQIIRGENFADILRRAEEIEADLVVLGIHRHSNRPLFRGTTAERIIRLGRLPVLVVRDPVADPYERVLVAVDLSPHSRRALEIAAELAPEADFRLVHATYVPFKGLLDSKTVNLVAHEEETTFKRMLERDLHDLVARLGKPALRWEIIVQEGLAQSVLLAQAEDFKPDLIAIGTHGRTGIAHAMLGSVAEDLLADAPTDVLAVKAW